MRRRNVVLLGPALALALAAAAPAAAAEVEVKGLDSLTWDKPSVTVTAGDTVRWTFDGTAQPHNVAASSANWSYRTELGAPPAPPASFVFATPGVYTYVCEVHATTMSGQVTVNDASGAPPPPAPPLPPAEQPFPNPNTPPGEFERGGLDRKRPGLSAVRAQRASGGARVRFRVSERSRVTVRFKRGGKTVKSRTVSASGRHSVTVGGLRAGRYRIELRARDLAGNRSSARRAQLTIG